MRVLRREFFGASRSSVYKIIPLGDIHIGPAACDEDRLKRAVEYIARDPNCYWVGMGDYCDFINRSDKRFDPASLAKWLTLNDLADLAKAQKERFISIVKPIAHKCLALAEGNHETSITKHYERHIFGEIVSDIKEAGKFPADHKLALGYYGWLKLLFYNHKNERVSSETITLNIHHGFGGGRLAGAKAINMERWLWTHDADICIFGHVHTHSIQTAAVEAVDSKDNPVEVKRFGVYSGTFLRSGVEGSTSYSERAGYMPLPLGGVELILKPHASDKSERIRFIF